MLAPRDGRRVAYPPWLTTRAGPFQARVSQITEPHFTQLAKGTFRPREIKLPRQAQRHTATQAQARYGHPTGVAN